MCRIYRGQAGRHGSIREREHDRRLAYLFFFSSRRRHTRYWRDWSSDVCSSDLDEAGDVLERDDVAEVLRDAADLEERRRAVRPPAVRRDRAGLRAHRRAPSALLRTRLLTSTAIRRITPRKRNRQSVFHPENWIPMNAMPTISAPSVAPIAEP